MNELIVGACIFLTLVQCFCKHASTTCDQQPTLLAFPEKGKESSEIATVCCCLADSAVAPRHLHFLLLVNLPLAVPPLLFLSLVPLLVGPIVGDPLLG